MASNNLGLRFVRLERLKVGQSIILGPYKRSSTVSAKLHQLAALERIKVTDYKQRQFLLIDPRTCVTHKVYLVTRIS